jgi:hypothetical protein
MLKLAPVRDEIVICPKCGAPARSNGLIAFRQYVPQSIASLNTPHYCCQNGCTNSGDDDWAFGFVVLDGKKIATQPNYPQ